MKIKKADSEVQEARTELLKLLKPGDVVYTTLRHCSRSGMQREISLHIASGKYIVQITGRAAQLLQDRIGKHDGIVVGGCGMDMGFHLVYSLSRVLFRETGFGCIGKGNGYGRRCPSNDHSNGGDYRVGRRHSDPGYALRHSWM